MFCTARAERPMYRSIFASISFSLLLSQVSAQAGAWGQCGGQGWSGPTTCISGYTCTYSNPYYSQCLPGASTTSGSTTSVTTTVTTTTTSTTTSTGPAPTGSQIRTVQDPVYHFYLQNKGGVPVLGAEASSGYFTIGKTIALTGSPTLYLNISPDTSKSYQALMFNSTAITMDWGLEGDTIITTSPRQLNFIACSTSDPTIYNVFLQNGNDSPAGTTCTMVTMHLPCLC